MGGGPSIEQYKQPDCRQLTTNARLADGKHFKSHRHSTVWRIYANLGYLQCAEAAEATRPKARFERFQAAGWPWPEGETVVAFALYKQTHPTNEDKPHTHTTTHV